MKTIRLGNDIEFVWTVDGLTNVAGDKEVKLFNVNKGIPETITYSISGDHITGLFKGKDQREKGSYRLLLYVNKGQDGMVTLDKVNAFELTGVSNFGIVAGEDDDAIQTASVELESELRTEIPPESSQVQSDWEEDDPDDPAYIKNKPTLAEVATSGSYDDLEDTPTIPAEVTESTVAGWGFTKNTGTYSKPSGGIPSTDMSSDVQASLGKADTALQTETDPTVPSWAKASSKPSYTASEVGAVPTTRTVNGKALSSDVTLDASDVGALPSDTPLFSGDYDDLSNKPTIPAAQVQSDWNATTGMGVILNKPTIPTVPTNVSAFTNDAGYLTAHQDISGKEDKVDIVSASGTTLTAEVGKYYTLSNVGTLAITLPTIPTGTTKVQTVTFYIETGSTPAVTFLSTHTIIYPENYTIEANGLYEIGAAWNGIGWVIGQLTLKIPT